MSNYIWLFIGLIFGIILSIILKIVFNCKRVRRNRRNAIIPIPTNVTITHNKLNDTDSNTNYSISIDSSQEETKEELYVRMAENA